MSSIQLHGNAVVVSVGDAICFTLIGENRHLYGNQRMWGAIGFGIFSMIAGFAVDEFSRNKPDKDYSIVFYILLVMFAFDLLFSTRSEVFCIVRLLCVRF